MIKVFKLKLKYEFHILPKVQTEKYIWGYSIEFRYWHYRIEFRYIDKVIAAELEHDNKY